MPFIAPQKFFPQSHRDKNLGWLPTVMLLESKKVSTDLVFGRKGDGSIWENVDALNPNFRFDLLSFQPRSSKMLSRDFFTFFRIFGSSPSYFRQIQTLAHPIWSPCYSYRTEKIKVGEVRANVR